MYVAAALYLVVRTKVRGELARQQRELQLQQQQHERSAEEWDRWGQLGAGPGPAWACCCRASHVAGAERAPAPAPSSAPTCRLLRRFRSHYGGRGPASAQQRQVHAPQPAPGGAAQRS
jgi:hypothetical protein